MREIDVCRTMLHNGLRVLSVQKDIEIFSMGIGIKSGSFYEEEVENGISHLVEHMLFKGTNKRDMHGLIDEIDRLAGDIDIYTTYHQTVLNVNIMKDRAENCIEIISDMLMNSIFPSRELSLEKKVVIEEIKMGYDDPEEMSYIGLYKAAFPGSWHRHNITGTIKSVRRISREMLSNFYRKRYIPSNTVICVVSPYSHNEVAELVNRYFGSWEGDSTCGFAMDYIKMLPRRVSSRRKGIGQTHVLYGYDIQNLDRLEEAALILLNRKIGEGPGSILFRELRDKRGYAYNVYSDMDLLESFKFVYIYAAISGEKLKDTISTIDCIIEGLKRGEPSFDEEKIRLIRDNFITNTVVDLESPHNIVHYILDGEMNHGNAAEYLNMLELMESVKPEDIKRVLDKVFNNPIIHILMPS
jgi:predicted Zn-dependent peptidase